MAKLKFATTKTKKRRRRSERVETAGISIPEKPTKLANSILEYSFLIHGEKKIGKTSLWAQEEGAFFLMFDPEQKALAIRQRQIPDWETLLAYVKHMEKGAKVGWLKIRTIVIDGADIMYQLCFNYMCTKMVIDHPHDENDFGKSWNAIKAEFHNVIRRLMSIPGTATRFICHSKWQEIKQRDGTKMDKLNPLLTGQAEEVLVGLIDVWAAYIYDGPARVLVVVGDESTGAGHRVDHCFRTAFDEQPIQEIYMGKSPKEAYVNLKKAFENFQSYETMAAYRVLQKKGRSKIVGKKKRKMKKKKLKMRRR